MAEYRGCELPEGLYYDLDYIWIKPEAGGNYRIGIADPSQTMAAAAPLRRRASPRHAGMMLSVDNRWFVSVAMVYFIASGAWLAWHGALVTDDELRAVGVHLFTAGFVQSLIYGLGAHMLPRFTGNPIRMGTWPWIQFCAIHGGLVVFAAGIVLPDTRVAVTGGVLMWLSFLIYAWRVWPVLWRHATAPRAVSPAEFQ
ncbi:MAG: hypothetical protein A3F74_05055 [Betaproteobacteria bacterium RIFCSPLOWO2_12_FULL_62_58]|nr:MAG: hypothetical protein A3F74_05055 [Betaproteobacteria bacterium RIFCSPLOWO2_12_FULL_62_58]